MLVCTLHCDQKILQQVEAHEGFGELSVIEISLPVTASDLKIDFLIAGPKDVRHLELAATLSDWYMPPATLMILPEEDYEKNLEQLEYHPRVGQSIFFCKNNGREIDAGLKKIQTFSKKRASLNLDNSISGDFCLNNVSPRWLFRSMMENLDEYIYFKDSESRFLAVSQYLVNKCGQTKPIDVLGKSDFDFFEAEHAEDAFRDEKKIANGEINELYKEEPLHHEGRDLWVASRKFPLYTRSGFLAGSYGLSRDITEEKDLYAKLKQSNKHMQDELLLARNLQETLIRQEFPEFKTPDGDVFLELASKYIPSFHLSGDFFSITRPTPKGVAVMIADVMGHGVRAAMVTAMIKIASQQLSDSVEHPAEFLSRLNKLIHQTLKGTGQTIFATAAYCYLDIEQKCITYTQAGGRHGVYIPADKSKTPAMFNTPRKGPALGLLPTAMYSETVLNLESDDELFLYTDGIIEASCEEEQFSEERLISFLSDKRGDDLESKIDTLLTNVHQFTKDETFQDDVCLLALRIR